MNTVMPSTLTGKPGKLGAEQHPEFPRGKLGWLQVNVTPALAGFAKYPAAHTHPQVAPYVKLEQSK
jgi:hypothetical protein